MRLTFLGVRGSTPAPGPDFVRYGGHTSCIAVTRAGEDLPTLVLDAGTGLRTLTALLGGSSFRGTMLLSHLHWDHVQGIPFFVAGDRPDAGLDVYLPAQDGRTGRDLIAQLLSPPAFPITPEGLQGDWAFHAVDPGAYTVDGWAVRATEVAHKGGRTYGWRVALDGRSLAYVPDHAPDAGVSDDTRATLRGVDVLIHDAQFLEPERAIADAYGHATVLDAVRLAEECDVGTLVLFHHGPARVDQALDAITDGLHTSVRLVVAVEGDLLELS